MEIFTKLQIETLIDLSYHINWRNTYLGKIWNELKPFDAFSITARMQAQRIEDDELGDQQFLILR